VVLGSVLLCVTGAEALYASIGRFGAWPIRLSWSFVVFPALILNYAGQTATAIFDANASKTATAIVDAPHGGHFYRLCPEPLLTPLIVLATLATIIASQSIITSAHSMTRQVIQLGWLPRIAMTQTSEESYGETYVGTVNWILMIVTLGLTIGFGKSDNLDAAYGIAASATMLMTSVLLFIAMREIWGWPIWAAGAVGAIFVLIDASFFAANMAKLFQRGWVPLFLASLVFGVMWIWHRGAIEVQRSVEAELTPLSRLLEKLHAGEVARVPGTAVFLTRVKDETPPVMAWHVRHARALHEHALALTLTVLSVPWIDPGERLSIARIDDKFWRAEARRGFMEHFDIPTVLAECKAKGAEIDPEDVTYFVGHETVIPRENGKGMVRWQQVLFAAMGRNAERISDYLDLPCDRVVEIGREIEI
jgi:KUP system potassium uptake protein